MTCEASPEHLAYTARGRHTNTRLHSGPDLSVRRPWAGSFLGRRKGIRPVKTVCWGSGVVVCLKQSADNSMLYIIKLYDLRAIFYSKLSVSKSIFMLP